MVSEVISFIILTAATIAASAIITGYLATAASQTTTRINEQAARQVLMTSESLTMVVAYACTNGGGSELCIDVMNNSGREIGISYVYDEDGIQRPHRIMDPSGNAVPRLPVGSGTIAISPGTIAGATLISENFMVYRIS
jgi:hypothetical protein